MFENAGSKLKLLAKVNFVLCVILNSALGYSIGEAISKKNDTNLIGLFIGFISGIVIGWLLSIMLYAFGELCENVNKISDEAAKTTTLLYYLYNLENNQQNNQNPNNYYQDQ